MKAIVFLLAFALSNSVGLGQPIETMPRIETIQNKRTEKHVQVKGTSVFMIPPVEFKTAENFAGFQQDATGASVMVLEMLSLIYI